VSKLIGRLTLDYPDPILSPNKHVHWRVKEDARNAAKQAGMVAARDAGFEPTANSIHAELTFFAPRSRKRGDLDNLLSSEKFYLDGICRGIGIDDRQIRKITVQWGGIVDKGGGYVAIKLTELD
jgi:Holliday junction resolvase RusA-like endonuclease